MRFILLFRTLTGLFGQRVTPDPKDLDVRLMDGPTGNEGRIEIFHEGEWGTVCDDSFSTELGHVFCRMAGYTGAIRYHHSARYGRGDGPIWIDEPSCVGSEMSVMNCTWTNEWGETDCEHHEDVSVECSPERIPGWDLLKLKNAQAVLENDEFKLRLKPLLRQRRNSVSEKGFITAGFLEHFSKDEDKWFRICADDWSDENSKVACGQLGFSSFSGFDYARYTRGERLRRSQFGLKDVNCDGSENNLQWCSKTELKESQHRECASREPVVLQCKPGRHYADRIALTEQHVDNMFTRSRQPEGLNVRLKSGGNLGSGRVEVMVNSEWGTVCHDGWSVLSANVVCRQLGFGTAKHAFSNSEFGNGHGPVFWSDVNCTGHETNIFKCQKTELDIDISAYKLRMREKCNHGHDVSVICNTPKIEEKAELNLRLVNGRHLREGRVEVQVDRKWGALCSDDFSMANAIVICRQLGFGHPHQFIEDLSYWGASDDAEDSAVLTGLQCKGDEYHIEECNVTPFGKCGKKSKTPFVGIVCNERSADLIVDTVLLEQSLHINRRSTGQLQCAAEENCLSDTAYLPEYHATQYWDPYRERMLLRFSTRVWNRGTADFLPKSARTNWDWHACHGHYHSMERFIDYDLMHLNRTKVAQGHKASFCLEDNDCEGGASRQYDCDNVGGGNQGISMGCADTYLYTLDCQWIDITDVAPGEYLLRLHVNPEMNVSETDYYNNIAVCNIIYENSAGQLRLYAFNCHIPDDYEGRYISQFYTERAFVGRRTGYARGETRT